MREKFGNMRQLPSGRWQVRYADPYGVVRKGPDTFPSSAVAAQWLDEVRGSIVTALHAAETWMPPEGGPVLPQRLRPSKEKAPVVYFLARGDHIKIGKTVNLETRIRAFQQTAADVLATIPGGTDVERQWHDRFDHLRDVDTYGGREWFRAEDELLDAIAQEVEK